MQISWQPASLPDDPLRCGHGIGICTRTGDERRLIAFVNGFGWLHDGDDAVVRFVPALLPPDEIVARELRRAFEHILRERQTDGPLPAGYELTVNG